MKRTFYVKCFCLLILFFISSSAADAKKLKVGDGYKYKNVKEASLQALPGDSIIIKSGTYFGEEVINNLEGNEKEWITIMAEEKGKVFFMKGSDAFHFSDPAYLNIYGLVFGKQTGNGVNIDDGGSFDTPAHHIVFSDCEWTSMDATGNNDELKLSGVIDFTIVNCIFRNGSRGGSFIDMVGCHKGTIERNYFNNGGSNSIQAKGGSDEIVIKGNKFENGGERGINIGGSTGMQFFRPLGISYEASKIRVWSNVFYGGIVPVAFVGSIDCEVVNNTIIKPEKWVVRILQENRNPGLILCSKSVFRNNIIIFQGGGRYAVNIGPNTDASSFKFSNNLWFNPDDLSWAGPETPVKETGSILNDDPLFSDDQYRLKSSSPAIGKGYQVQHPLNDYFNNPFKAERSIGAVEYN